MRDLRAEVYENLNNAIEGGYTEVKTYTPEQLADDLIDYTSDFDESDRPVLIPLCKEWLENVDKR